MMFPNLPHPHTLFQRVMAAIAGVITSSARRPEPVRAEITAARNEMIEALLDLEDRIVRREQAIMAQIERMERKKHPIKMGDIVLHLKGPTDREVIEQLLTLARDIERIERGPEQSEQRG